MKADYFLNTTVYEYFYKLTLRNKYVEWHNEEIKKHTK